MDFQEAKTVAIAWWASNIVGLIFVFVALKSTRMVRLMFVLLFGYASWVNYSLSRQKPEVYLDYADHAVGLYAGFIQGWFSHHITTLVTIIAAGQLCIAIAMLLNRSLVTLACIGVIIFLTAIAPLGLYAAFPFSLTVSVAAYLIIKRDSKEYLWKGGRIRPNIADGRLVS